MKFQYSPGLIGYGPKGADGSSGLSGLALYFTDYDPVFNLISIENAIENNYVLLSGAPPGTKLPGGRVYVTGDLFVDPQGSVYEIDAEIDEFIKKGALNKNAYFNTNGVTTNGFTRWFNIYDASIRYIIDNNLSLHNNYNVSPSRIYGIELKDFTRIEHTDVNSLINAFSIYSTGVYSGIDDRMALAIVRDASGFRIGNIDGLIRDTNLTLDVSLLQQKKEDGNKFSLNTPSGTILTNVEISTNLLFDPNFEDEPLLFTNFQSLSNTTIQINWNLADFTSSYDPSIQGSLYFCKPASTNISYNYLTNTSTGRSMIFHDVEPTGSVVIDRLTIGGKYEYYMILTKDGWERCSKKITAIAGGSPFYMYVRSPVSRIMTATGVTGYTGFFDFPFSSTIATVEVSTFVLTKWNASIGADNWITIRNLRGIPGPIPLAFGDGSTGVYDFDASLSVNLTNATRIGNITFTSPGVPTNTITVTQGFKQIWAEFDSAGNLTFTPSLTDQNVSVSMKLYAWARGDEHGIGHRDIDVITNVYKAGVLYDFEPVHITANGGPVDVSINKTTALNVTTNNVNVTVNPNDCQYDNHLDFEETMGWAELTNVTKISGTGSVDISTNKIWYRKRTHATSPKCTIVSGASSVAPSMPPWP